MHLLIAAAGSGRRMGATRNKLLLPLSGQPVLAWTLQAALAAETIHWIGIIGQEIDRSEILDLVGGDRLSGVVTTHRHHDHWGALADVARATHAPTYAHDADADAIDVPTRHRLRDEDSITVGDVTLGVIHLVGHTPGSLVITFDDPHGHTHLFTGDCLVPGGVGRTWSPEDFDTLYRGVVEKIFDRFDDDTWIYPGHGDDTTLGRERPSLDEWRERGW